MSKTSGGSGNDTINGSSGKDTLSGDAGNDQLFGGADSDRLYGDAGDDTLTGGSGSDFLYAGEGNDVMYGADDLWDEFYGGDGNDTIYAGNAEDDWAYGGAGADSIFMGAGADLAYGGTGNDTLNGQDGNDTLYGDEGDDIVYGGNGNDLAHLGDGNDSFGSWSDEGGNDSVYGGAGNDSIIGGSGDDKLFGDEGIDTLSGGIGSDSLYGGTGNDTFLITDDHGYDYIEGGADWDYVQYSNYISTVGVTVTFTGSDAGTYTYGGGATNGTFKEIEGIGGTQYDDTIDAGADTNGGFLDGKGGNDSITGGAGADQIYGGDGNDALFGGAGNDVLDAGAGNDTLFGGTGDDTLYGGAGIDQLSGGAGNDALYGGDFSDSFFIGANEGVDQIFGGSAGYDFDTLVLEGGTAGASITFTGSEAGSYSHNGGTGTFTDIEGVQGTAFDDTIDASASGLRQVIWGGAGGDSIATGGGDDYVDAGAGNDTVTSGAGNDVVNAGMGDDRLSGGRGDDALYGEMGNDTLIGGVGSDTLTGGAGADVFGFDRAGGADRINDFNRTVIDGKTIDQLDISELRTLSGDPVKWRDVTVSNDGSGNAVLTFPEGESVVLQGVTPQQASGKQNMGRMGIPCFASGTTIDTADGPRLVEGLRIGDLVTTLDHGPQPIRWIQRADHSLEHIEPTAKPVLIAAGALGHGLPRQDLIVSPQHRMLVGGRGQLDAWFANEGLAPAKSLTALPGVRYMKGKQAITWVHFACDRHEVVTANGCLSETLLLGPMVLNGLSNQARHALLVIYGAVPMQDAALNGPAARRCLKVGEVRRQIAKCKKVKRQRIANEIKKWDVDLAMEQQAAERLDLKPPNRQKSDLRRVA